MPETEQLWQEIAWNEVVLHLPGNWVPAVIEQSYLFFEENGLPVFAIKWNRVHGGFSAKRILHRLQRSLKRSATELTPWDVPTELLKAAEKYSVTGFQCRNETETTLGMVLFCPHCRRSTILQAYSPETQGGDMLTRILASFTDHPRQEEQKWRMYDISAKLPVQARLQSHEFLAGRYALSFALPDCVVDLYRFKPAAAILKTRRLEEFGASLAGKAVCVERKSDVAVRWEFSASGFELLAAAVRRQPRWIWLQLKLIEERNAILAVKGCGNRAMDRALLEYVADNFTVTAAL